ncbi:heme/hemin ABC transporter substrate-binding protein [Marinomonas sp. PE14-40]|uniref:heme/hemin ABC transporter substrate-binding protein n=1 Tax=Marinomonas sp. PE14-40 TaxID=3060621 RepID=UPI003F671462
MMKSISFALTILLACHTAFAEEVKRIVSADGSLTEIVYALGQEHKLVGVDTTSGFPITARFLPQIGYRRNISAEGVLSLEPQVLIATQDSGPEKILNQIEGAGVKVFKYSDKASLNAVREKILAVSKLLGKEIEGKQLWQKIELDVIAVRQNLVNIQDKVKVLFVLSMQSGSPVVSGADTHAAEIIYLAGGVNAAQGFSGYKPMPVEAIIAAQPDIILMMDRGGDHGVTIEQLNSAGFSLTPAGKNQRIVTMDGMKLLGFGPRIADAIRELGHEFYPDRGDK